MESDSPDSLGISARVHLVPDGRTGWRAFGSGPSIGVHLTASEAAACLDAPGLEADHLDQDSLRRLRSTGVLVPPDREAQDRRRRWTAVGWGPALNLLDAMRTEPTSTHDRLSLPTQLGGGPITEVPDQGRYGRSLGQGAFEVVIGTASPLNCPETLPIMAVLAVDHLEPGWYVNGEQVRFGHPDDGLLSRIAPVAFGRASFPVTVLQLLFVRCDTVTSSASRYVEAHVGGGVYLALIEARASERDIPFRSNYAVSTRSLAEVHAPPAGYVSVGAIAVGAP